MTLTWNLGEQLTTMTLLESSTSMKYDVDNRPMIRLHSTKDMEKFSSAVDNIDWSNIYRVGQKTDCFHT